MLNLNEENCIFNYTEKMIAEIISKHDKETLKANIIEILGGKE